MEELELNKFDPRILEKKRRNGHSPIIVLTGKRGSGKSTILKDLGFFLKDIPLVICQSGTEEGNGFFSSIVHPLFIYNKFEPEVLIQLVNHQKRKAKILKAKGKDLKTEISEHVCVILDDLAYNKDVMKLEAIREIMFNGRHYGITLIITFQFMMDMKPEIRTNVDYIIVCKENKKDNIDRLYKYFFSCFDKISDFKKTFNACTNDYGCIVLDNTSGSERIEDQVYWYKARLDRNYKFCAEKWAMWDAKLKEKKASEKNDDDDEDEGKTFVRKEKSSNLIIKKKGPKKIDY
jgi:hypothetical protein